MLDAHSDSLKMQNLSYMNESNQSHFTFILFLYLHFMQVKLFNMIMYFILFFL